LEAKVDQSFWTFIAAMAAAVAAGSTFWYAILTRRTIRASLLSHVLTKYSSRERIEASKAVRDFKNRHSDVFNPLEKAKGDHKLLNNELEKIKWETHFLDEVQGIDAARGCLSAFYWEVKTYCRAGYLDKEMIAAALGSSGHELYLGITEPLDRIKTKIILQRDDYDESIREYFEESARKYF
jgi:hypothetical protein